MGKQGKRTLGRQGARDRDAAKAHADEAKEKKAAVDAAALSELQFRKARESLDRAEKALETEEKYFASLAPFKEREPVWYEMKEAERRGMVRVHTAARAAHEAAERQVLAAASAFKWKYGSLSETAAATPDRIKQELAAAHVAVDQSRSAQKHYEGLCKELRLLREASNKHVVKRTAEEPEAVTGMRMLKHEATREVSRIEAVIAEELLGQDATPVTSDEWEYRTVCEEWTKKLTGAKVTSLGVAVDAFSARTKMAPSTVHNMIAACADKSKPDVVREAYDVLPQLSAAVDSFEALLRPDVPAHRRTKLIGIFLVCLVGFTANNECTSNRTGLTGALVREAQVRLARDHAEEVTSPTSKEGIAAICALHKRATNESVSMIDRLTKMASTPKESLEGRRGVVEERAAPNRLEAMRSFAKAYEREATPTGPNGKKNLTAEYDRRVAKMLAATIFDDTSVRFSCPKVAMLYHTSGFSFTACCSVAEAHQRVLLCKELRATQERVPSLRVCAWCKEPRYCPSVAKWVWGPLLTPTFRCAGCVPPDGEACAEPTPEFGRYCSAKCQKAAWSYQKPSLFDEVLAARTSGSEAGSSAADALRPPSDPPVNRHRTQRHRTPAVGSRHYTEPPSPPVNRHRTQRHRDVCPRHDLKSKAAPAEPEPEPASKEFDGLSESEVHRGITMGYFEVNIRMGLTLNADNVPEDCTANRISVPKLPVMELCEASIAQILTWKMPPLRLYAAAGELCGCIQKNALEIVASSPVPEFARARGAKRIARKIVACFYIRCAHPLSRKVHCSAKLVRAWKRTLQHRATAFPHDWHIRKALQRKLWEPTFPCDFDARFVFKSSTFFVYEDGHKPAHEREQQDCELLLDHHADGSLADSSGPFAARFRPSRVQLCSGVPASEQSTRYDYMESFPETLIIRLPTSRFVENAEGDALELVHGRPWVHCPTAIRWSELPFRAACNRNTQLLLNPSTEHELVAMQVGRMRRKSDAHPEDYCIWWAYLRERDGQWYELYGSEGTRGVWDAPRFGRRVTAPMAGRKMEGCFPINLFYQRKRAGHPASIVDYTADYAMDASA